MRGETYFRALKGMAASVALAGSLAACSYPQSALHPAGEDAERLSVLTWFMFAAAVVIWAIVMGAAIYAVVGRKRPRSERFADRFILAGGVAFPTVSLAALLIFGLSLLPDWSQAETADLEVHVTAEQFWWRFTYLHPDGRTIETANELHLPTDATVQFALDSTDVIHSFWIPALGGKMDAIPGRTNTLRLTPRKPGTYRGVCAEFCGASHALMAFPVVVHEPAAFAAWLDREASPAAPAGSEAFLAAGCGGCHVVRGVTEAGSVGPDLTHFASRSTLGAGTVANTAEALAQWLLAPEHLKPGVRMPSFAALPEADRAAIVEFLGSLE